MKKLLSTIMALVMLLSLVPMAVAEEGEGTENGAVQSNDVYEVTDAAQLIWAVENHTGDTIKLVEDVTLSSTISIGSNEAKTFVLDLGGKTLKGNIDFYAGDLTIQNGTIDGRVYANATKTDMKYGHLTIAKDAVIKGGFDSNGNPNAVLLWQAEVSANNYGATVDIYGTLEKNLWVIGNIKTDLTTAENPCVVNVHDGAVIKGENGTGVAVQGAAKVTVGKAAITGSTGIEVRAGELTVDGATVVGTAKPTTITPNGNGTTTDGAGIAVAQHTTKLPIKVTINSGDISGYSALYQSNPQNNGAESVEKVSVAVNGGTFKAINGGTCGVYSENNCVTISGGAFTDLASAVKYATNGATITLAGNVALDKGLNIGSVGSEQKVLTLDLNGHSISATNLVIRVQNANLTVTGPGKIYETSPYYGAILIKGSDNAENKDYTVVTVGAGVELEGWSPIFVDQYKGCAYGVAVNVDGAKLTGKRDTSGDMGNAIYVNGTIKDQNNAPKLVLNNVTQTTEGTGMYLAGYTDTTITGGSITGGNTGIEIRAGELTVNGATVVGNGVPTKVTPNDNGSTTNGAGIAVAQHTTKLPIKVTINSGDISGYSALYQSNPQNNGAESVEKVSVAVNGGTFKAINGGTCGVYSENNCVAVTGGTFSSDPTAFVADTNLVVVPNVGKTEFAVQPKTSEDGTVTKVEGNTKTETKTDGNTKTETKTDLVTGATTETKTENKVEGNVTTKTETVTEKNAAGVTTKATETVTTVKTENGGTTTVVTKKDTLKKTETTEVTGVTAPTTASDVTLDVKNTTNVAVNKDSMTALKDDAVKDVIIETKDATLKLDKTAVKTMERNVPTNGKMTLNVTVTEEKNATTTEIEKVKVEVTAKNEAGQNVFPENTANTNGLINITIPYNGNAKYLDLWYVAANASATYMGRFPVVNGFVSFDVKHFSQYDLIPVASSGSSVIKTGAGSSAASTTQTVTTDLTPGSITKVTVDGKVVDAKYYTVSGSNVTFTAEFLKTLKNGSHTVTVENATKIAKGVFTVNNPTTAQSPTTADAGIALYAGMAIASVMGTGVVFTSRKRKNH